MEDEKIRYWTPRKDEKYYAAVSNVTGKTQAFRWKNIATDFRRLESGNIFRTKAHAEEAKRRIKQVLIDYQKELVNRQKFKDGFCLDCGIF
jgi:hypothetical protein